MRKGFTLIELMIVIAIIAIIAAIAIPNLLESRVTANENAAATGLKSAMFAGQTQYASGSYNDVDGDNRGEYGHLGQMSGQDRAWGVSSNNAGVADGLVGGHSVNSLSLIGREFDTTTDAALLAGLAADYTSTASSGYLFGSLLAHGVNSDPAVVLEQAAIDNGEKYFFIAAGPEVYGDTGRRLFIMTQDGKTLSTSPKVSVGAAADYQTFLELNNFGAVTLEMADEAFTTETNATDRNNRTTATGSGWGPYAK